MKNQENWKKYFEKTNGQTPRPMLVQAIDLFEKENFKGVAFDIGAGAGNETNYLIENNWKVIATDNELESQEFFKYRFNNQEDIQFQLAAFENIKWQEVDLVNASYSLPFCEAKYFEKVMLNIIQHIKIGGRFSGNFFGPAHTWSDLVLLSKEEVLSYFKDFEIEFIEDKKENMTATLGDSILMHNISIIAKKLL